MKKTSPPIMPVDLASLPSPLKVLVEKFEADAQPFRKAHRLVDVLEWIIKWHTVLVVSDLLRESEIPATMKIAFAEGLRTPSLGTWIKFYRETLRELLKTDAPWGQWDQLLKLEEKNHSIAFRNKYAHGATPDDAECLADIAKFQGVMNQMLGSPFFTETGLALSVPGGLFLLKGGDVRQPLGVFFEEGHAAACLPGGAMLDLWPLAMCSRPKETSEPEFYYFNAMKDEKIEQLNYELPSLLRNKDLWASFLLKLPLATWKKESAPGLELFRERMAALTEGFKGRREELARLLSFCREGKGRRRSHDGRRAKREQRDVPSHLPSREQRGRGDDAVRRTKLVGFGAGLFRDGRREIGRAHV